MITDTEINQIIKGLNGIRNSEGFPYYPSKDEVLEIKGMFKSLMKQDVNKNLSPLNQRTLLEGIVEDFSNGSDYYQTFNFRSDNKHMQAYDYFFKEGEGKRITDILKSYGLGADELKGVPLMSPFDASTQKNGRVYVKEEIEKPDGESPYIKLFEIYVDGKIVYEWKGRAFGVGDVYENINIESEDIKQPKRKSKYQGSVYISDFELPVKKWTDKNGRDFYTQGKKRVSRSMYEQ